MSGAKQFGGRLWTLDQFLAFAEDEVDVQIKHGIVPESERDMEIAFLMHFWHVRPFALAVITPHSSASCERSKN
jgi:hypothetical protein